MNETTPKNITSYNTKLVGVTFEGRQGIISNLLGDEKLRFRREPENEYDKDAVAIDVFIDFSTDISKVFYQDYLVVMEGRQSDMDLYDGDTHLGSLDIYEFDDWLDEQQSYWAPIGYIARDKNGELANILDNGKFASIKIADITGGGKKSYGVNVAIEIEKERKLVRPKTSELVKDIFGNDIYYDDVSHSYTNALGEVYLSGSKFASQHERPFPAEIISKAIAKKNDLEYTVAQDIQDMWSLKGEASMALGTAIHASLELYGRFKDLSESIDKTTYLHDNPILKKITKEFYDKHPDVHNVKYECLVVDNSKLRAGRIDRLKYNEDESVTVEDFKTNVDIDKSLENYWLQLSFYAAILEANGLKVNNLEIHNYTPEGWITYRHEVIDIDEETK